MQGGAVPANACGALRLARRTFMAGERIDVQKLAAELGVDRTTLYRWVGNRDQLLVAVLTSLADPTLRRAAETAAGNGPQRVAGVMRLFSQALIDAPYYRTFLRRETERALRLITTKASPLQQHVVGIVERLLEQERDRGHLAPAMCLPDLAYLVVRIVESFVYADLITGDQPDAGKVELAIAALLRGATDRSTPTTSTGRATTRQIRTRWGETIMADLQGTCDPRFTAVRDALQRNIDSGEELGASLVLDIDGERVIDLWGGFRDEARTTPWDEHTITNVWSTTKTVTSLAALMLVDRGQLDVHAPVARYWPEFAANGKQDVLVRHLLAHTSGVSGMEAPAVVEDLYDWEKSTARYAAQAPWWEPGTASGYHAGNFGHLIGEVLRRITGKSLKQFVAEEIAGPLGADFQIGAVEKDWGRIAPVTPPPQLAIEMEPGSPAFKTLTGPITEAGAANTPAWRNADIGGMNGHGNARSVARMLSALALGGEVDGVRLLGPDTIDLIFDSQADGIDLVLGVPLRFGIGYGLPKPVTVPWIPDERICFWGGWGGSMIVMDLPRRMTVSYMMNKMGPGIIGSQRSTEYGHAIYAALG